MATNTADRASQLVDQLANDAQFRDSVDAAPTLHDKAQVIRAAGYSDISLDAVQTAVKERLAAIGAGVQVDPERAQRAEELFVKLASDQELQHALQAAETPEAKRDVLAQAGYGDLTTDDLRAAAAQLGQREELSDEELELVSGGGDVGDWMSASSAVVGGSAMLGGAVGGPVGAGIGALVGIAAVAIGITLIPDPPPVSDW